MQAVVVVRTEPEVVGGHAVPAVAFGQHLGQQAGAAAHGFAPAAEATLAAELGEVGRLVAAQEVALAEEHRPVGHQLPRAGPRQQVLLRAGQRGVQRVGLVRVVAPEALRVVDAVDGQRVVQQAVAAVDHDGPRRVLGHDGLGAALDLRLDGLRLPQVAGVDEGDLVLDGPDEDGRVVALLADLGLHLVDPVVEQLFVVGQAVEVVGALAVEDAAAAHGHAVGVHEVQHLLGVQPAEGAAPEAPHVLAALVPEGHGLLRVAAQVAVAGVRVQQPRHAVELELRAVPTPLAEAEGRAPHVQRLAALAHRGHHVVHLRVVRPPELRVLPRLGDVEHLLLAGGEGDLHGSELLRGGAAGGRHDLVGHLHRALGGARVENRDLQAELLVLHGRLGEDVAGVDAARHHQARRLQDAGLQAVVRADREVQALADVAAVEPRRRNAPREPAALAGLLRGEGVVGVLDDDADVVVLPRLDGLRHVALEERVHRLRPAAILAVDDDAGDQVDRRQPQVERAAGHIGRHVDAGAVDDAMGKVQVRALLELVAGHADGRPERLVGGGQRLGRSVAVDHVPHLVVAADLPESGERHLDAVRRSGAGRRHVVDLRRRLAVLVALPVLTRLVLAVRMELALGDAEGVGGVEDAVGRLLAVLLLHGRRRPDFDLVLAGRQVRLAELDPGDLDPLGQVHAVRREVGRRDRLPLAAVDAPVEGRAHELVADAVPYLVVAGRGRREVVAEEHALLRQLGQIACGDLDDHPLPAR